jgi:chromosome segregation ATPase
MMSAKRKPPAHAQLDQLRQQAAQERTKQRDLQMQLEAAKAEVDRASGEVADAYAAENQRAVTAARKTRGAAMAQVRELQNRLEGAEIRVDRAQRELDTFQREHAEDLIAERIADVGQTTDQLNRTGHEFVRLHHEYLTARSDINSLVALIPGAVVRYDGPPASHAWETQLRALERAMRDTPELPATLPRWHRRSHRQREDKVHRLVKAGRGRSQTAVEQARRELLGGEAT